MHTLALLLLLLVIASCAFLVLFVRKLVSPLSLLLLPALVLYLLLSPRRLLLSLLCICFHLVSAISSLTCLSFFLLLLSCRHVCCPLRVLPLLHACPSCYRCVHPWLRVVFTSCTYLPRLTFSSSVVAPDCSADGMRVPASATCSSNFSFGSKRARIGDWQFPILIIRSFRFL